MKFIFSLFLTAVYLGLLGSRGTEAQVPKPSPIQFVDITASTGINWSIAKIHLGPGNGRTLTFTLNRDDLSFIGKRLRCSGGFELYGP